MYMLNEKKKRSNIADLLAMAHEREIERNKQVAEWRERVEKSLEEYRVRAKKLQNKEA